MAVTLVHTLLILVSLLLLLNYLAGASDCPSNFECGNLGPLEFPLSDRLGCGLFLLQNCSYGEIPRIQFEDGGTWYTIVRNISTNKFLIFDPLLPEHKVSRSCLDLATNMSLPLLLSPSISLHVSPNLTLFTCRQPELYFQDYNHTRCSPFDVYYRNSSRDYEAEDYNEIPSTCSMVQLPIYSNPDLSGELWDLLTPEYVIEWNVSDECYQCHHDGGKCLTTPMNRFNCDREAEPSVILIVSTIFGCVVLFVTIISVIIYIVYHLSRCVVYLLSRCLVYLLPRCLSFDPSSKRRGFTVSEHLKENTKQEHDLELFLKDYGNIVPRRYKYSDLEKMTNSFLENLGKGGYGSVYKGILSNGQPVAVKILNESKGNGEEFMNEVASISRTSHVNVVTLVGFCFEGSKRALIYDFMPNGSLEKYLQNSSRCGLGWEKLFEISLGIARGLDYLHRGCNTRILHFDIKPHNILLDKDFNPKISDFGLAKLCPNRSSTVSMMVARGTIGYIAPEVFCQNFGTVSYKSDVYSYGMMILEIAGEKRRIDRGDVDRTSETYFPDYIYRQLESDMEMESKVDEMQIMNEDESKLAKRKLTIVGLWCIQTDPKDRPSMSKVVEMLEGKLESLQVPSKPYISSPPRMALDFSTTSMSM